MIRQLLSAILRPFLGKARPGPQSKRVVSARTAAGPRPPARTAPAETPEATGPEAAELEAPAAPLRARASSQPGSNIRSMEIEGVARPVLSGIETALVARIGGCVAEGRLILPQIPATTMQAIEMTSNPGTEISAVVEAIEADPVLSSELLKVANSVAYAGQVRSETLHDSAVRLGFKGLRSLLFALSMRGMILRDKELGKFAEEIWRQCHSMASIARAIAEPLHEDPERVYLLGLLQDLGKISLLEVMRRENKGKLEMTAALLGRVFNLYHETAGAVLARSWNLPMELVSVAGCHHRFADNPEFGRSAAIARLAHRLDLYLALDGDAEYREQMQYPELEYLEVEADQREAIFNAARAAVESMGAEAQLVP